MYSVRACRACLESTDKMYDLRESPLRDYYEHIAGLQPEADCALPQLLCAACSALARKCALFRRQCVIAHLALQETYARLGELTEDSISSIDRGNLSPALNLRRTVTAVLNNATSDYADVKTEDDSYDMFDKHDYETEINDKPIDSIESDEDAPLSLSRTRRELKVEPKEEVREEKQPKRKKKKLKKAKTPSKKDGEICVRDVEQYATLVVLSHERQVEEMEKRKCSANFRNSPFKCDMCYKGFVDTGTYNNHMRRHGPECGEFECAVCHIRRSTAHRLRGHVTAVHSRKYTCKKCERVSTNANQALEHEKWHRGVRHPCQFCDKSFSKWSSRLSHERLRHRSQFVCCTCGDAFVSRLGLAQHRSRAHKQVEDTTDEGGKEESDGTENAGAYCAECDVHFSTQRAYTRHTLTSDKHGHDATMTTGCRRCGVVFTSEEAWAEHAKSHAVRCGRVRKRLYVLPRHGSVACQECGEEFKAVSHCVAHYKTEHPGVRYPAEFVCETCGRKCKNRAVLLYHQRTHTGERPYPCAVCGAAFKHQSNLRRHSRVHTGEKLFQCELCYKRFTQKVGMEMHVRTVHEKQPYPKRNRGQREEQTREARSDFLDHYRAYKLV